VAFVRYKLLWGERLRSDDRAREVEFLNGVCVLCRLEALREIGLLDETMGGYVEDTDWAWRARGLRWKSVYTPVRSIVHHQAETGYEHYALKMFMLRRNTIYWHYKRGAWVEAAIYGYSARFLAWWRATLAVLAGRRDRGDFVAFARRLARVDREIRDGATPGDWFGPPLSPS